MMRSPDLIYNTTPSPPQRCRINPGDGSIKKAQFTEKQHLVFHSIIDFTVNLYDTSFVPDLRFNLFCFHVGQEKHKKKLAQSRNARARWLPCLSPDV